MDATPAAPIALVTGASSGIGLELARELAAGKHDLVLVARSEDKLATLAAELSQAHGVRAQVIKADLAQPGAAAALVAELDRRGLEIEVLVNNAGYASYGPFIQTDLADELAMMQLNVVALTHLTKLLLIPMVKRGHGRVMNVASTAAFQPGPLMAVYYATKAFVLSLSEALANEVAGSGVTVTALCPGATTTGFAARSGADGSKLFEGRNVMDAKTVAQIGVRGMLRGRTIVIPGALNKVMAQSARFFPRKMLTSVVRQYQERATH